MLIESYAILGARWHRLCGQLSIGKKTIYMPMHIITTTHEFSLLVGRRRCRSSEDALESSAKKNLLKPKDRNGYFYQEDVYQIPILNGYSWMC